MGRKYRIPDCLNITNFRVIGHVIFFLYIDGTGSVNLEKNDLVSNKQFRVRRFEHKSNLADQGRELSCSNVTVYFILYYIVVPKNTVTNVIIRSLYRLLLCYRKYIRVFWIL